MRAVLIALVILLLVLQYRIWFGQGSYLDAWRLRHRLIEQTDKNADLQERNRILNAEVKDLKHGHQAVEEQARTDLGMVKKDEKFYQIVHKDGEDVSDDNNAG